MGEAGHTIHLDAEFLSIWEHAKPDKLCFLKIQGWHRHGTHFASPQGDAGKNEGMTRPKQVQNPARQILLDPGLESTLVAKGTAFQTPWVRSAAYMALLGYSPRLLVLGEVLLVEL